MVKRKQKTNLKGLVVVVLALLLAGLTGAVININIEPTSDEYTAEIEYSEEQVPAALTDDMGEVVETTEFEGQEIPTGQKPTMYQARKLLRMIRWASVYELTTALEANALVSLVFSGGAMQIETFQPAELAWLKE